MLVNRTVRFLLFGLAEQTGKPTKCQNVNHISKVFQSVR